MPRDPREPCRNIDDDDFDGRRTMTLDGDCAAVGRPARRALNCVSGSEMRVVMVPTRTSTIAPPGRLLNRDNRLLVSRQIRRADAPRTSGARAARADRAHTITVEAGIPSQVLMVEDDGLAPTAVVDPRYRLTRRPAETRRVPGDSAQGIGSGR
jgi:hypothetical protein